jgi:hypothetical protein
MANDQKPAEDLSAFAAQTMEQTRNAVDTYFDYLKRTVSAAPSGGTEYGEKLKSCAEANLATTHEFVRRLSQAQDFTEMVRIQAEFMQSLVNAFGEQRKPLPKLIPKQQQMSPRSPSQVYHEGELEPISVSEIAISSCIGAAALCPAFTNQILALTPIARSHETHPASSFDAAIGST